MKTFQASNLTLDDLETWHLDGTNLCYYNSEKGICFYVRPNKDWINDWWEWAEMEQMLECPFCESSAGGFYSKDIPFVKEWMGRHLAIEHKQETIIALSKLADQEELKKRREIANLYY